MKKIVLLFIVLLLIGCGSNSNDIKKLKDDYESLNSESIKVTIDLNNKVTYLNAKQTVEFLENKTGVIFFGVRSDLKCRMVIETLLDVINDSNVDFYYYDLSEITNSQSKDFAKILGILNLYLQPNENGEKTLSVPDVYFVKNGEILGNIYGTGTNNTTLTEEEKEILYNNYKNLADFLK